MIINKYHQDFLESEYPPQSLIMMNPPWAKIGNQFITKAVNILKPGGELVCIMDYNKFTRYTSKNESMFRKLQKLGHFKFISTDVSWGNGYFRQVADSVHFVWRKSERNMNDYFDTDNNPKPTIIKNRKQEIFDYQLKGNEQYVPQMKNDLDFFDWDNGIVAISCGSKMKFNKNKYGLFLRREYEKSIIKYIPKGAQTNFGGCMFPADGTDEVDLEMLEKLIKYNSKLFYNNYTVSHGWPRFPPFKRNLLQPTKDKK